MDYWLECVTEAFEDSDILARDEQIAQVADWMRGAHENYSLSTGLELTSKNFVSDEAKELYQLKEKLERKRVYNASTSACDVCSTTGRVLAGWGRSVECPKCGGTGRVK